MVQRQNQGTGVDSLGHIGGDDLIIKAGYSLSTETAFMTVILPVMKRVVRPIFFIKEPTVTFALRRQPRA